jgi:titin
VPIKNVSLISVLSSTLLSSLQDNLRATDDSALDDVNYYYYVTIQNLFGNSTHSNEAVSFASSTGDVPDSVSTLAATGSSGHVTLTWSNPTYQGTANLLTYIIGRSNGTTQTFVGFMTAGLGQQTFVDTTAQPGITYQYAVLVSNNYGSASGTSNIVTASTSAPTVPTAPLNPTAFSSAGQIQLNWSAPASVGGGITEYRVFRSSTPGGEGTTPVITVPGTSLTATDVNVISGNLYYYVVKAVNTAGIGPASNEVSATATSVPGAPSAPLGLTAMGGNNYIMLNWTAPATVGSGISQYWLYRGLSASGESSQPIAQVAGDVLTYNDTTVTTEIPYYYVVKAMNANGTSNPSNEATATALNPALPSSPQNVVATGGSGQIVLTWGAPASNGTSPLTGYTIYRSVDGSQMTLLAAVGPTNLTYTDKAVSAGHTYGYNVIANNANGNGPVSSTVTATTSSSSSSDNTALYAGIGIVAIIIIILAALLLMRRKKPVPSAPVGLTALASAGKVQLKWTAPAKVGGGITEYRIYRGTTPGGEGTVPINTVSGTMMMFDDLTVMPGTTYYYVVRAVNSAGVGVASNEVIAKAI